MKMMRFCGVICLGFVALVAMWLPACGTPEKKDPLTNQPPGVSCDGDHCTLSGTITKNLTLTADKKWLLRGGVFIGDDEKETVLTIEAGTTIFGETSTNGMLVIRRASKIMAEGTKEKPIIFTSSRPEGSRARGDWGGLIINGRARLNSCSKEKKDKCEAFGEGGTGWYGGDNDDDNSGVLKYVRVEFAGRLISPDNELNGIAFQGVGSGTRLEYIQVHMNKDDGIEFFGGTANMKYALLTGIADDSMDWTDGWRGKAQFVIVQQYEDAGDNGIEADNNGEDNTAKPRSKPTISNITLIGSPDSKSSDLGMLLREGTAANIHNAVIVGWNQACLKLDHKETFTNAVDGSGKLNGELLLTHSVIRCKKNFAEEDGTPFKVEDFFTTMNKENKILDPQLVDAFNLAKPNFKPKSGSPISKGAKVPDDPFFTRVEFLGGMGQEDWTAGWTTTARN